VIARWIAEPRLAKEETLRKYAGTFSVRLTEAGQRKTRVATLPPNFE
jgi:hypothetical protein